MTAVSRVLGLIAVLSIVAIEVEASGDLIDQPIEKLKENPTSSVQALIEAMKNSALDKTRRRVVVHLAEELLTTSGEEFPNAIDSLTSLIDKGNEENQRDGLRLLSGINAPKARQAIARAASDAKFNPMIREEALTWYGASRDTSTAKETKRSFLRKYLADVSPTMRITAALALAHDRDASGVSIAQELLEKHGNDQSCNFNCKRFAILTLQNAGGEDSRPTLQMYMNSPDPFLRVDASRALQEIAYRYLPSISEKSQLLEKQLSSAGFYRGWAISHLLNVIDGKEEGNVTQSLEILRKAGASTHPAYHEVSPILRARCSQGRPEFCVN